MELDDHRDKMICRSSSSEGKMVIKLKIPKLEPETMEVEKPPEEVIGIMSDSLKPAKEGKKICLECRKEFSSGKALGGHMRVHVNQSANKNPNFLKPSKTIKVRKTHQDHNNGDDVQSKPYYMNSVNDEGKPTCSQCGKTFPSMKSLFGHMRCHPERVWRGILPPPNTSTAAGPSSGSGSNKIQKQNSSGSGSSYSSEKELSMSEDAGGDQVVDLTKFLHGWSVTDRRGRRAALKAFDDDEGLLEAVEDLMSLANGGGSMSESGVTHPGARTLKVEVTDEGSNSNSLSNKEHKIDPNSPSINFSVTGKGKAVMDNEIELELEDMNQMIKIFSDDEFDGRNNINEKFLINYKYKNGHKKIKKGKKMKLMMELEPNDVVTVVNCGPTATPPVPEQQQPVVSECKFKCTTCNKCFTSHQALGGHRSSHNKPKIISTDRVEEADYKSFLMNLPGEDSEKEVAFGGGFMVAVANGCATSISNGTSTSNIHQCKICDKIFATGQALGGHQRCHWTGPTGAQAPSSQITYTGEAASQTGDRKVLDFDLNEVPTAIMEEYEGGNNGYASSSYNSNMC